VSAGCARGSGSRLGPLDKARPSHMIAGRKRSGWQGAGDDRVRGGIGTESLMKDALATVHPSPYASFPPILRFFQPARLGARDPTEP
jgi:hypothetical protein